MSVQDVVNMVREALKDFARAEFGQGNFRTTIRGQDSRVVVLSAGLRSGRKPWVEICAVTVDSWIFVVCHGIGSRIKCRLEDEESARGTVRAAVAAVQLVAREEIFRTRMTIIASKPAKRR